MQQDRLSEWFVPKFGPKAFRLGIGILFLPYTGMVVSFAAWGSLALGEFSSYRLAAICLLYFFALGISAHCLDALSKKNKPWGELSRKKLTAISLASLSVAFAIGLYYVFFDRPLLFPIGIAETFFLFAYNLEWFHGRFHNNTTFVISWGILPVIAGSVIQNNSVVAETALAAAAAAFCSYIQITTSKKYKKLKRQLQDQGGVYQGQQYRKIKQSENILKVLSVGVIGVTVVLFFILRQF